MPANPSLVVGFLLLSALLSAIPGPSVLLGTSRAITRGRRSAMLIVLGNFAGGMALLALVLAGLGVIVATSAKLFMVVKLAGAGYLLWLGIRSILSARSGGSGHLAQPVADRPAHPVAAVRQGFLVGVANPKSIVSLMAILPQFVDHNLGHPTLQMLVIGVTGGIAQLLIETLWVIAAGSLRTWFQHRPSRMQALKATGGVAMIGLAGKLAIRS
ncbi:LysE family translocator [Kribbella soli]|uniref:LysE family translocator n=1 Tax=Kribbella soli TaxID=1124743 RepID=A0A4V6N3H5_9ACTN|nr:LysE family translocator [Kribbella soli]TCC03966.1 LysE family translocator [Kribbella soli]